MSELKLLLWLQLTSLQHPGSFWWPFMQRRMQRDQWGPRPPLTDSSLLVPYPGQCLLVGKYSSELRVSLSFCRGHATSNQQRLVLVPDVVCGIICCSFGFAQEHVGCSVLWWQEYPTPLNYFLLEKASCDLHCVIYLGEGHSWLWVENWWEAQLQTTSHWGKKPNFLWFERATCDPPGTDLLLSITCLVNDGWGSTQWDPKWQKHRAPET